MKRITLLIALLVLLAAQDVAQAQPSPKLLGTWSGKLQVMGSSLTLVFHLEPSDGDVAITLDSPDQGATGISCTKEFLSDDSLAVRVDVINATYRARLQDGHLKGHFSQNGMSFPLTLEPKAPMLKRPQTPRPPFPYAEEEVTFENAGYVFHGTLTLPKDCSEATPVLVMVTGSGQQNRDEEMMGHRPFAVIADALARQGIATMRFDDRPQSSDLVSTIGDHLSDAAAGVRLMRERFHRVGVIGHSEGGTIALMLASEGLVDACISLAGMAVSGRETLLDQNHTLLAAYGIPADTVAAYCDALAEVIDALAADKPLNVNDIKVPQFLRENFSAAVVQLSTPYMRGFLATDVRRLLPRVTCPVLALHGKRDTQVSASTNLAAIDEGLKNSQHEVVAFDGLNHLFQHCQTGLVGEYALIEETFAPEVIEKISEWVKALESTK